MGVFSTEVWVVLPKVLLPCLLTRGESQLNASRWLAVSTLYRGITSHCLGLGGPIRLAGEVALPGSETFTGPGVGCHHLDLGKGSGGGEGEPWVQASAQRRKLLLGVEQRRCWLLSHQYLVGGCWHASEFHRAGSWSSLVGGEEVELALVLLLSSLLFQAWDGLGM